MARSSVGRWKKLGEGIALEGSFIYKTLFRGSVKLHLKKNSSQKLKYIYIYEENDYIVTSSEYIKNYM